MSDHDWDRLAALAQAATPGPWESVTEQMVEAGSRPIADAWTDADAEFIAAANPATILRLIDLVRELQRRSDTQDRVRERLTAERDRWKAAWEMADPILTERDALDAKVAAVKAVLAEGAHEDVFALDAAIRAALDGTE